MIRSLQSVVVVLFLAVGCEAYYLPGVAPQSFSEGDDVKLKVNSLTSAKTLLPIDYYRLPFCQPIGGPKRSHENLGEFLSGDRIENSPYVLKMKTDFYCKQLCSVQLGPTETLGRKSSNLQRAIRRNYHNNWIVDNLPSASKAEDDTTITTRYWQGFPIGYVSDNKAYINNHVNIEIMYHPTGEADKYRVVRFTVEPFSIHHEFSEKNENDDDSDVTIGNPIESCKGTSTHTDYDMMTNHDSQLASGPVLFTYDVIWSQNPDLKWASRWDIYLTMDDAIPAKVHWVSIANSLIIVLVLSAMIVAILVRNLRRDFARYNALATDDEKAEDLEEFGWKLVHADVFRAPTFSPLLLSVAAGTGAQLVSMSFFTIIISAMGFISPAKRGALLMAEVFLFVLMGTFAGYVTARLYKMFEKDTENYQTATLLTALGFPGIAFTFLFLMNLIAVGYHSTDAVPFTTMLLLLILWFGISTPLVFLGAYLGYKADCIEYPTNTSRIPRPIPPQPWFMGAIFSLLIGGILPFGACFVELYFIMASIWTNQYYYVFGFLLLVYFILVITCAEITVLFNYFQLCGENYNWWWRSFITAGSTAFYVFLYSFFYFKQLEASSFATYVLYFGYMGFVSFGLFLMTGFIGLMSSLWFNIVIFGSIKID